MKVSILSWFVGSDDGRLSARLGGRAWWGGSHLSAVPLLIVLVGCGGPTSPARAASTEAPSVSSPAPGCTALAENFTSSNPFSHTVETTGGSTTDVTRLATGGASGSGFLRMAHLLPSPSSITVFYLHPTVTNLASGSIARIEYREDRNQFDPPFSGAAIGGGFFLLQNGQRHVVPITGGAFTHLTWQPATVTLTPADFPGANLTSQGGPIQFGFYRGNTNNPNGAPITTTHGIDNWEVTVCR
jgi:hypothetical protein